MCRGQSWGLSGKNSFRLPMSSLRAKRSNPCLRKTRHGLLRRFTPRNDGGGNHDLWIGRTKKKARLSGPSKRAVGRSRSGGLAVDLGEVVLRGLGAVGDELAEIFGGGLRPRDEQFATRTDHVRLDLGGFAQRRSRSELVDAGEERFRVLIERLLDVAADLGGLGDRTGNGGLDRGGHLLGTGVEVGSANLGGLGLLLHELTGG